MDLKEYFENTKGTGVLSTADSQGNVDCAIYARPHVMQDGNIALIMRHRLSRQNLQSNPRAAYMFIEQGPGYKGKRLFLTKTGEEQDQEKIQSMSRRSSHADQDLNPEPRSLVYFRIEKELPLVGSGE